MRIDFAVIALSLMTGAAATAIGDRDAVQYDALGATESHDLYKRRGGGGGGGRGGGGGGSRGGGGSSSGGSRGGSGSSGGSRGGSGSSGSSGSNTRPNSNTGGTSRSGSGPQPSFGGGRYYGGGASQPFRAGASSRSGTGTGLAAGALIGAGAIAFWPGHWYHGVYPYHYRDEYEFFNHSANPPKTERLPVICGCAEGSECGCDDSGDKSNLKELIGDGSYDKLNKSLINVGNDQKGRKTIFLNGTLPNGTTTSDAAGAFGNSGLALGLWPVAATAFAIVFTS